MRVDGIQILATCFTITKEWQDIHFYWPLLFLVYINDLPLSITCCALDLFTDDAALSSTDHSVLHLTNCLNADLKRFQEWCERNDMIANILKTKAMFISSRIVLNKIMENSPDLQLSNETIQISKNEKLLGVYIDNKLFWSQQIEFTIKPEDQWSCKRSPDTWSWYIF